MKSDRLLAILLLLQARGRVPAAALAGRLEVSVRTIYRDVEALSAAGVPVYAERGRNGGIALMPGYRTDVTGLTRDEVRALFVLTAQGAHADLGLDHALGSALRKVMAALPEPHRPAATQTSERVLVDPAGWRRAPKPSPDIGVLQNAVFADRRVLLRYRHSGQRDAREYLVDPYGLVDKAGVWYLVADHDARPRLFRASRILGARVTDAPVRHRPGLELAEVWAALRREVEGPPATLLVEARVRRSVLPLFCRIHAAYLTDDPDELTAGPDPGGPDSSRPDSSGADPGGADLGGPDLGGRDLGGPDLGGAGPGGRDADGWVPVNLRYRAVGAARGLLGFGADVEVLAPPEVRADLAAAASAAARVYGPGA
ncbi:MAG: YafY family protein [Actinocatenispora sp.]